MVNIIKPLQGTSTPGAGDFNAVGEIAIDTSAQALYIKTGASTVKLIGSPAVGSTSIVTTGALDAGSITSGFGAIDNGTSNITTGGLLSLDIDSAETINGSGGGIGAAGSITLGAGADAGMYVSGDNLYIENKTQDKDIIFRANDGGTFKTLLTLDGSGSGVASFNDNIFIGDNIRMNTDGAEILFGTNEEIKLAHRHDIGLRLTETGGGQPTIEFYDANEAISSDGSKLILKSNAVEFAMPTADGSANQVLKTDGSGALGWATTIVASANNTFSGDNTFSGTNTYSGNLILDDGSGASPVLKFINGNNNYWQITEDSNGKLEVYQGTTLISEFSSGGLMSKGLEIGTAAGSGADVKFYTAGTAAHVGLHWDADSATEGALLGGVDDHGVDLKFFGETSGKYMHWDMSNDELILGAATKLSFHDQGGGENIVASADGHLEINAGTTVDITAPTVDINCSTELNIDGDVDLNGSLNISTNTVAVGTLDVYGGTTLGNATGDNINFTGRMNTAILPNADSTHNLGSSSLYWANAYIDAITTTGDVVVGDDLSLSSDSAVFNMGAGNDFTITHDGSTGATLASTGDFIIDCEADITLDANGGDIKLLDGGAMYGVFTNNSGQLKIKSGATASLTLSGADVTVEDDLFVKDNIYHTSDGSILGFGVDTDVTLTHVADTGLLLNGSMALQFNDSTQNIKAPNGTTLDINATDEIELNATLVDINANLDVSGSITLGGTAITSTAAELNILDGVTATATELNIMDGVTATTAELNIMDGVTATATELNIIDGVTATTAELNILDGVTATATEINLIDGGTARGTTAVASGDGFLHNDGGTMRMTNVSKLADRLAGSGLSNSDGVLSVGTLNQDTTGTAATVTGAAQSNITSLGTLTTLTVDHITIDGSTITDAGALDFNIGGDLTFDVDGSDILLKDDGQERFHFKLDADPTLEVTGVFDIDCSNDIILDTGVDDIIFKYAGTTSITFDLSANPDMDIVGDFKIDGEEEIEIESGNSKDIKLDSARDVILDYADGEHVIFKHNSTTNILSIGSSSSHAIIQPLVNGKDIRLNQYDGRTLLEINDDGFVGIANGATGSGELRIYEDTDNGSNYTGFKVGAQSADIDYILPTADGSNGQQLTTNGSGTLSWASAGSAGGDANQTLTTGSGISGANSGSDGNFTMAVEAAQTTITSLFATDIKIGEDDQTKIDFETADKIHFYVNNVKEVVLAENSLTPGAYDGASLGTTSLEWSDLYLADEAVIGFGEDQDVTLTHVHNTGLLLNSDNQIQFSDSTQYIYAPNGTTLDIHADEEIEMNASNEIELNTTLVDINANVEISGTLANTGKITATGDVEVGDDLILDSDSAVLSFGDDNEIKFTHVHNQGVLLQHTADNNVELQLTDSNESVGSDGSKLILTSNGVAFSMPTADGSNGQQLTTDGGGTLSWAAAGSGGGGSGTVNSGTATALAYYASSGTAVSDSILTNASVTFEGQGGSSAVSTLKLWREASTSGTNGMARLDMGNTTFSSNRSAPNFQIQTQSGGVTQNSSSQGGCGVHFKSIANGSTTLTTRIKIGTDGEVVDDNGDPAFLKNMQLSPGGTGTVLIQQAGAGAYTFDAVSDETVKHERRTFNYGLKEIEQLQPEHYKFNKEAYNELGISPQGDRHHEVEHQGLMAQDVEKIMPELVYNDALNIEGVKNYHRDGITAALINAVKELSARVAELEKENNE